MHPAPPPCLLHQDITMSGETTDSKDAGRFEKLARMAVLLLRAFSPVSKLDQTDKTERYTVTISVTMPQNHHKHCYSSASHQEEGGARRRKVNRQLISLSELAKPGARQIISERVQQRLQPDPKEDTGSAPTNQQKEQTTVSKGITYQ